MKNKKLVLSFVLALFLIVLYCVLNALETVSVFGRNASLSKVVDNMDIVLGGEASGIKLLATGVLVVGMEKEDSAIQIGDVILKVNGEKIETNEQLMNKTKISKGTKMMLEINRKNEIIQKEIVPEFNELSGEYKLGLWVKDSSAGVGTITFYNRKNSHFAALGHGVTETKENYIVPITTGGITKTNIYDIKKGVPKNPGELKGTITTTTLGEISKNTEKGIYGKFYNISSMKQKPSIKIKYKNEIKEGKATVYTTLTDNTVQSFEIMIEKVMLNSSGNKNMIIRITDQKLIDKTGGIVQGMSGSPIVQDGKLVGAVTHVFLNDPTKGYAVFIEHMIEDLSSI